MKQKFYFSYIKDAWSNDFNQVVAGLSQINGVEFLVKAKQKILFKVNKENLARAIKILSESVKPGAWHDLVSVDEVVAIFSHADTRKVPLDALPDDLTWLKMKELEPAVREYKNLREMIDASVYKSYI